MIIVVNDIVAVPESGGVYTILMSFYDEVKKYNLNHKDVKWYFILSGDFFEEDDQIKIIKKPEIKKSWLKRLNFEFISGSKMINKVKPDIYISLENTMTLGVRTKNKWVYLHQALPYQKEVRFSLLKKNERKLWIYQHLVGSIINFTIKKVKVRL